MVPDARLSLLFRQAMKGFGTSDKVLIAQLAGLSRAQTAAARQAFTTIFQRDLLKDVRSECSGNYKKVLEALIMTARSRG